MTATLEQLAAEAEVVTGVRGPWFDQNVFARHSGGDGFVREHLRFGFAPFATGEIALSTGEQQDRRKALLEELGAMPRDPQIVAAQADDHVGRAGRAGGAMVVPKGARQFEGVGRRVGRWAGGKVRV